MSDETGNAASSNRPTVGGDRNSVEARTRTAHKRAEVVRLVQAGLSFEVIAEQVGYADRTTAYKAWRDACKETVRVPTQEVVNLELERLDALQAGLWDKAVAGDFQAVDRALAILTRRSRLLGLDVPVTQRVDLTVSDAQDAELRRLAEELAGGVPSAPVPVEP